MVVTDVGWQWSIRCLRCVWAQNLGAGALSSQWRTVSVEFSTEKTRKMTAIEVRTHSFRKVFDV